MQHVHPLNFGNGCNAPVLKPSRVLGYSRLNVKFLSFPMVYFLYFLIRALFVASHDKIMDFDFTFWGNSADKTLLRAGGMPNHLSGHGRECAQKCKTKLAKFLH